MTTADATANQNDSATMDTNTSAADTDAILKKHLDLVCDLKKHCIFLLSLFA